MGARVVGFCHDLALFCNGSRPQPVYGDLGLQPRIFFSFVLQLKDIALELPLLGFKILDGRCDLIFQGMLSASEFKISSCQESSKNSDQHMNAYVPGVPNIPAILAMSAPVGVFTLFRSQSCWTG